MKITMKSDDTPQVVSLTTEIEDGVSLRSVLARLAEKNQYVRDEVFDPLQGTMRDEFFVIVNGALRASSAALDTQMKNSDCLELIPPVSGG
jgi:molybdopterin converting factor small subunit